MPIGRPRATTARRTPAATLRRELPALAAADWARALQAWDARGDLDSAHTALTRFEDLARTDTTGTADAWCARAVFFLGEYTRDAAARRTLYARGLEHGRRAVAHAPDAIGARFWCAACHARYLDTGSMLRVPLQAPEIIRNLRRVFDQDKEYYYGALARFLGVAYIRQPGLTDRFLAMTMPGIWPDTVLAGLRRAADEAPPFVTNYVILADVAFHARNDRHTAREMLDRLDTADLRTDPNLAPENHLDLDRGRKRLGEIARRLVA